MGNENVFFKEALVVTLALVILAPILVIPLTIFSQWDLSEDNVSGIVYSTTNNGFIAGNTNFKVRAGVDTYINEKNESSYCLPRNSQYKELVNKAAADKTVKVQVTTHKGFWFKAPWTCIGNVTVTEVK